MAATLERSGAFQDWLMNFTVRNEASKPERAGGRLEACGLRKVHTADASRSQGIEMLAGRRDLETRRQKRQARWSPFAARPTGVSAEFMQRFDSWSRPERVKRLGQYRMIGKSKVQKQWKSNGSKE